MTYKFKCNECGATQEVPMPMASASFEDRPCQVPSCKGVCVHVVEGAPGVLTQNMSNQSFDVAVGKDAEKRWKRIRNRQAKRNKVRMESGEEAVRATSYDRFEPLKGGKFRAVELPETPSDKLSG